MSTYYYTSIIKKLFHHMIGYIYYGTRVLSWLYNCYIEVNCVFFHVCFESAVKDRGTINNLISEIESIAVTALYVVIAL